MNAITNALRTRLGIGLFAVALVVMIAACDTAESAPETTLASEDLNTFVTGLSQDLSLSPGQADDLKSSFARYQDERDEPGFLWRVAADLQEKLTDEQKERLFAMMDRAAPGQPPFGRFRRGGGPRGGFGDMGRRANRLFEALDLTQEQQDAIKAIHENYRDDFRALFEQRKDGSLTPEAFRDAMKQLRDTVEAEVEAVLTDEQKAQLEELKAERQERRDERREDRQERREQAQTVRNEVLGLTADQVEALENLEAQHRDDVEALMEQARNGDMDRDALKEAFEALLAAHQDALAELLDETQLEIVQIHRALAFRVARHADGPGGPGAPGPGGSHHRQG